MASPRQPSMSDLRAIVAEQKTIIAEQKAHIERLENIVKQQAERITELEKKLDEKGKPPPPGFVKANRKKKPDGEKKQNRTKRSTNHARKLEPCTEEVLHAVESCPDCGRKLSDGWEHGRRQVLDLPETRYIVRDHVLIGRYCGQCKRRHIPKIDLSGEVTGKHRVSIRVMALVAYLKTECRQSLRQIRELLEAIYGLKLSDGAVTKIAHKVAAWGREEYEKLRQEVRSSPVVHADETGWREDGINGYLWTFVNERLRFFVRDRSRGSAVPLEVLGEAFDGVLVSDFYSGYGPLECTKQRCWVHLLRDLDELTEDHADHKGIARWVERIRSLYEHALAYRREQLAYEGDVTMALRKRRQRARREFERRLLSQVRRYLSKRDDPRHTLSKRIEKFVYEMFVFVEHPAVPPENNLAERALRPAVIHRKVCGGTRSARGSETMATLRSLFGTWRLQGHDLLAACQDLLTPHTA
ncbi:MAG: IS66 family transposase [Armatimonadia bacterium]|nr:IS66 family transposase [Armatimonadia bacterium]